MMKSEIPSILGRKGRCRVLSMTFSKVRIMAGRKVTQHSTPMITPLIITTPRSRPRAKVMKISAAKPAMVVTEEPMTDRKVSEMASPMAALRSSVCSRAVS